MKSMFLTPIFIVLCITARSQTPFSINTFQVDDNVCVQSKALVPNTVTKFYSKIGGGKKLYSETSDSLGVLSHFFDVDVVPAFVLNNKWVSFTEDVEFNIQNLSSVTSNSQTEISFKALSRMPTKITYCIIKVDENGLESIPAQLNQTQADFMENFTYTDNTSSPGTQYLLRVIHADEGPRYEHNLSNNTSSRLQNNSTDKRSMEYNLFVYPTLTRDVLNIRIDNEFSVGYIITSANGSILSRGIFIDNLNTNTINVSSLPAGEYLISFPSLNKTIRFVKLE